MSTISTVPPLPQIDYTSKDFTAFRKSLIDTAPTYIPEWTSRSESDFLMLMIELFSYIGDIQSYYTDRVANEMFLGTAQLRSSVLNIAALLDYQPSGVSAAQTTLQFSIAQGSGPITIPAGTQVGTAPLVNVNQPQLIFETSADLTIYGAGLPIQIDTFTGNGASSQVYTLTHPYTGIGAVITVQGVTWKQVSAFAGSNILSAADSDFETGFPGTYVANTGTAITQSNTQAFTGSHSLALTAQGAQSTVGATSGQYALPTAGAQYSAVAAFKAATTPRQCYLQFRWYDASHALISVDTNDIGITNTTTGWLTHTYTSQAPQNAAFLAISPVVGTNLLNNEVQWVDTVWVSQGSAPAGPAALIYTLTQSGLNWVVTFGNGSTGAIPGNGSTITATYSPPVTAASYIGSVNAVHGITITREGLGTSTGGMNQDLTLFNSPVVDGTVQVFVDEGLGPIQWVFFTHLSDAVATDPAYTTYVDSNNITHVVFGDGINGRIPGPSSAISATYREGGGVLGNVGSNTLTQIVGSLPGVTSVTNPNPAVGGAEAETLDHIRQQAPKSVTAINRAVTTKDYAALALKVPGVAKASAVAAVYTSVTLYVHPVGGFLPTTGGTTLASVVNALIPFITNPPAGTGYLDDKMMIGANLTVLPPQYQGAPGYVPINVTATVQVLASYSAQVVQQSVIDALGKLLAFNNVDFGTRITLSSVYKTIDAVPGVDYVNVNLLWRADQSATAADVVCQPSEIPTIGSLTIATTGGLPT